MIVDYKYSEKTNKATWKYKAKKYEIKLENPGIVKLYEYLERLFVLKIEDNTSVLYIYDGEGKEVERKVSTKDFCITGFRGGVMEPEIVVVNKGKKMIYIYDVKKKRLKKTKEVL